jgi:hypothetical protein
MMGILNMMTSIYWGQLSKCRTLNLRRPIAQYTCDNPALYGAVSAFAALVLAAQFTVLILVVLWRDDILERSVDPDDEEGLLHLKDSVSF